MPARPRSLAVFSLSVRGARREFEDQFRGLPIELVDLKNKFLATSYRYQGISRPPVQLVEVEVEARLQKKELLNQPHCKHGE